MFFHRIGTKSVYSEIYSEIRRHETQSSAHLLNKHLKLLVSQTKPRMKNILVFRRNVSRRLTPPTACTTSCMKLFIMPYAQE